MTKGILKRIGMIVLSGVLAITAPVTAFADETTENSGGSSSGGSSGGGSSSSSSGSSGGGGSSSSSSSGKSGSTSTSDGSSTTGTDSGSSTTRSVTVAETYIKMNVGETKTLTVTVADNITDLVMEWSSEDNSVASVSDGIVTAVAPGKTHVKLSYSYKRENSSGDGGGTKNITVTVADGSSGGTPTASTKKATKEELAAEEKIWEIINKYMDPEYHLAYGKEWWDSEVTESQFDEIKKTAESVVAGKNSDYDKIKAITEYVAENIYYDYDYYQNRTNSTNDSSYEVFKNKIAVCEGYSLLMKTMCNLVGIPCVRLHGSDHAYNAAYAADKKRWICLDATWCSGNKYNYNGSGGMTPGKLNMTRFDMTPQDLAKLEHHETYAGWYHGFTDGTNDSFYYSLLLEGVDISTWRFAISGTKSNEPVFRTDIMNIPVEYRFLSGEQTIGLIDENNGYCKVLDLSNANINEIPEEMFMGCKWFKSIILPQGVKSIGERAFYGCSLEELDLSKTQIKSVKLRSILLNAKNVKRVSLPDKIRTLNISDFYPKKNVTIIVNGDAIKTVNSGYGTMSKGTIKIKAKNKTTYKKALKKFKKVIKSKKVKYRYIKG